MTHQRFVTAAPFGEVDAKFRAQLRVLDTATLEALFAGTSDIGDELCLFTSYDHGRALALDGRVARVVQHVVGNPLVAEQMTKHDLGAGLYAPLRVLIWEDGAGQTIIEYDVASSLFGRLGNRQVDVVAAELDRKLEAIVKAALG